MLSSNRHFMRAVIWSQIEHNWAFYEWAKMKNIFDIYQKVQHLENEWVFTGLLILRIQRGTQCSANVSSSCYKRPLCKPNLSDVFWMTSFTHAKQYNPFSERDERQLNLVSNVNDKKGFISISVMLLMLYCSVSQPGRLGFKIFLKSP